MKQGPAGNSHDNKQEGAEHRDIERTFHLDSPGSDGKC